MEITKEDIKKLDFEDRMTFLNFYSIFKNDYNRNMLSIIIALVFSELLIFCARTFTGAILGLLGLFLFSIVAILIFSNWKKLRKNLISDYFKIKIKKEEVSKG